MYLRETETEGGAGSQRTQPAPHQNRFRDATERKPPADTGASREEPVHVPVRPIDLREGSELLGNNGSQISEIESDWQFTDCRPYVREMKGVGEQALEFSGVREGIERRPIGAWIDAIAQRAERHEPRQADRGHGD